MLSVRMKGLQSPGGIGSGSGQGSLELLPQAKALADNAKRIVAEHNTAGAFKPLERK